MKEQEGASRRDFIKTLAASAVVLGTGDGLAFAETAHATAGKSKVVIATDSSLRDGAGAVDSKRILALLDRAMESYYGTHDPVEPWKRLVHPGQTVGLKVNTIAGPGLSTNVQLVAAVTERLQQAGIQPHNIIVWDRTNRELERAGFHLSSASNAVQCFGTDAPGVGYESQPESYGSARCRLSKILTQHCDVVINIPLLKHHSMAGMTLSMKNMFGVIDNPRDCHANGCNPGVADVAALPTIRKKVRFTIGDATTCCYEGGPGFKPEYVWQHNSLLVGHDLVALDFTGWQIIERKRAEKGLKSLQAAGTAPGYIAAAAEAHRGLGTDDPRRIRLIQA